MSDRLVFPLLLLRLYSSLVKEVHSARARPMNVLLLPESSGLLLQNIDALLLICLLQRTPSHKSWVLLDPSEYESLRSYN